MDYKTISTLLGEPGPGLVDYDKMVSDRQAKTQAELADLDNIQSLIDYTTPPQLRAAKMDEISGRRDAIAKERQSMETDEDFLRRYASSRAQVTHPDPIAQRPGMDEFVAPSPQDMIHQPRLSDQTFQPDAPIQDTSKFTLDPMDPSMGMARKVLEPAKEFLTSIPRGAANIMASAPAYSGSIKAASGREAIAYLDQSETLIRRLAEMKNSGADQYEIIQQASDLLDGSPQAMRSIVSQALGDINAGDDPETVIQKYRGYVEAMPTVTKETGDYKLAEAMHEKINETLPVTKGYEDSMSRKLGEGAGSIIPIIGASVLTGPAGGLATGMATQGGAAVEEAVGDGASEEDIHDYGNAGFAIGSLEALPVGKLLGTGKGMVGKLFSVAEKVAPGTTSKVTSLVSKLSPAGQAKYM